MKSTMKQQLEKVKFQRSEKKHKTKFKKNAFYAFDNLKSFGDNDAWFDWAQNEEAEEEETS